MRLIVFAMALDSRGASYYNRRMSNTNSNAAVTALDSDGEEFTLDFGFPSVATRPVVTRDEDTADGRAALDARKGRNAAWRDANLVPPAKPRG